VNTAVESAADSSQKKAAQWKNLKKDLGLVGFESLRIAPGSSSPVA
jgi:hypothetical protein